MWYSIPHLWHTKFFFGDLEAKTYAQNSGIIFTFRIQKNFFEIPIGKKNSKNCLHFITFVYHKGGRVYHLCGIVCYTCGKLYNICGIQKIKIRLFKDIPSSQNKAIILTLNIQKNFGMKEYL